MWTSTVVGMETKAAVVLVDVSGAETVLVSLLSASRK